MMRLEATHPGTFDQVIGDLVPACAANGNWGDVTFGNALDMATGNYALAGYMGDEGATHTNGLFLTETHAEKIDSSCRNYSPKAAPGRPGISHPPAPYIPRTHINPTTH